jgi:hypothetical protein
MHHNNRSVFRKSVLLERDSCVLLELQKIAYYKLHKLLDYKNHSHLSLKSRNNQQVHAKVRVKQGQPIHRFRYGYLSLTKDA